MTPVPLFPYQDQETYGGAGKRRYRLLSSLLLSIDPAGNIVKKVVQVKWRSMANNQQLVSCIGRGGPLGVRE